MTASRWTRPAAIPAWSRSSLVGETLTLSFAPGQNGAATITVRATDRANASVAVTFDVVVNPVITGTPEDRGPRSDDDRLRHRPGPGRPDTLRIRRNDEAPIFVSLIAQTGVTIDGDRGNDRFDINLAGLPNLVPGRTFTLIVSGGTGDDRMNLFGLPAVPGVDLVLDGETTDFGAPSVGANPGDVLDLSRLPNSAQIVAYNDSRRAGAIRLDYRDGPSVTGFSLRNFGSTTGLASDVRWSWSATSVRGRCSAPASRSRIGSRSVPRGSASSPPS